MKELLRCLFWLNIWCAFRKSKAITGVMDRCMKCKHYLEFLKVMDEEDAKVMDEIDEMRRFSGELE